MIVSQGSFGSHPLVARFLKGVFEQRPALPRYQTTWAVSDVLKYLQAMGPLEQLTCKDLTLKTVMLVTLLSGQRCQTVHALTLNGMEMANDQITFTVGALMKSSRPGKHIMPLVFKAYTVNKELCVVTCLKHYLAKTSSIRNGNDQLWLSFQKPHKPVSKDTVACWINTVLGKAGINTACYSAHSTRSASTSAACVTRLPVDFIMKAAGWSNESTFQKFYNMPVEHPPNFGEHLLLSSML